MRKIKNLIIPGSHEKPVTTDLFINDAFTSPLIIYAHGFNGFKDWGNFDLIAEEFVRAGFHFIKFNFSHNGTTPLFPEEFADLQAYALNNYTLELSDLSCVIDWSLNSLIHIELGFQTNKLFLLGHSMGGGIVLVKASEDSRVDGVAGWASVGELTTPWGKWSREKLKQWEFEGVAFLQNSRTKQEMPLNFQLYEDYQRHQVRLNVEKAVQNLRIPVLLCHGTADTIVPPEVAFYLAAFNPEACVYTTDSDHVFGRRHPWHASFLPEATQKVLYETIQFFKNI